MLTLFKAELKRTWSMIRAYPLNQVGSVVILAVLFYMLFLGTNYMAGGVKVGSRVDSIFVGYVCWLLMMQTYQSVSSSIREESTQGTLLQLLTSPYSASEILFWRAMANAVTDLVMIAVTAVGILLLTGIHISFSLLAIPFVLMSVLAATGLGFMLGAVTLLIKKADMLLALVQYGILFAVLAPVETWGTLGDVLSVLIPTGPSAAGMRILLVGNHFSVAYLGMALLNVLLYLGGGLFLFRKAERRARKKGLLGAF